MIAPSAPADDGQTAGPSAAQIRTYLAGHDLDYSAISQMHGYSEGLAAIKIARAWGFVDRAGRMVVAPRYDDARSFSDGLAAVSIDDKWGFIDTTGKLRLPTRYSYVDDFSDGLAMVETDSGMGYIDTKGRWAIPPKYQQANDFVDGVAVVVDTQGRSLLIDHSGGLVKAFDAGDSFEDTMDHFGVRIVEHAIAPLLINVDGRRIPVPPQAKNVEAYGDGLLITSQPVNGHTRYGAMDAQGRWLVKPTFQHLEAFSGGLAIAQQDDKRGLIDKHGKFVVAPAYHDLERIAGGLYLGHNEEAGKHADLFDASGHLVLSSACVGKGRRQIGKWTILFDCDSTWIIREGGTPRRIPISEPEIEQAGDLLLVQAMSQSTDAATGRKFTPYTLLGPSGIVLSSDDARVKGKYDWAMLVTGKGHLFEATRLLLPVALLIDRDRGLAILTSAGQIVRKPEWRYDPELTEYTRPDGPIEGPMVMKTETGWGAVAGDGNWIIGPYFDHLSTFGNGIAIGTKNGKRMLVSTDGQRHEIPAGYRFIKTVAPYQYEIRTARDADETKRFTVNILTGEQTASPARPRRSSSKFHEGLAPAQKDNSYKWGLRNQDGKWVVPAQYDDSPEPLIGKAGFIGWKVAREVKNDFASSDTLRGLVSAAGQEVLKLRYGNLRLIDNGTLIKTTSSEGQRYGLAFGDGRVLLPPDYDDLRDLGNGWFFARQHRRKGLVDKRGNWVVKPGPYHFEGLDRRPFTEETIDGEKAFIDVAGRISTRAHPQPPLNDNPAYWWTRTENDKEGNAWTSYYSFDWKLRARLPGEFDGAFSEGTVAVEVDTHNGSRMLLAHSNGKTSGPLAYEEIKPMTDGLAVAVKNMSGNSNPDSDRYGYINRRGKIAIPAKYQAASSFSEGRAVVVLKGNVGVIDRKGRLVMHSAWRCGRYPVLLDGHQHITWPSGRQPPCTSMASAAKSAARSGTNR